MDALGRLILGVNESAALSAASDLFADRLAQLPPDTLDADSACTGWTVFDLVNHVIGGGRRYLLLLQGADADEVNATRSDDHVGRAPVESFWHWQKPLALEFTREDALVRTVQHPLGPRAGADLLGMRMLDLTLHAWDLSRSLGLDEWLNADLVAHLLDQQMHLVDQLRAAGAYAEQLPGAYDSPEDELLRRTGRNPATRPVV